MISWDQVMMLRDDVGQDAFDEVVAIFLEDVEGSLAALTHGPSLEQQLHALKGSALNLGFADFATLCAEAEQIAATGQGDHVSLGAIRTCYAESRAAFLAELPARTAA